MNMLRSLLNRLFIISFLWLFYDFNTVKFSEILQYKKNYIKFTNTRCNELTWVTDIPIADTNKGVLYPKYFTYGELRNPATNIINPIIMVEILLDMGAPDIIKMGCV